MPDVSSVERRSPDWDRASDDTTTYPLWIKLPYSAFVAVLVPVYWVEYGPTNFLWFSDIALFALLIALWTGNRLIASMMAVGVLPFETVWLVDFISGGTLTGTAAYMFEDQDPLYLRALSLFHLALPPIMVWMLYRQGYDPRALPLQIVLSWIVLIATYLLTDPQDNINAVFGLDEPQNRIPPLLYLGLYILLLPALVMLPMHWLLKRLFGTDPAGRIGWVRRSGHATTRT